MTETRLSVGGFTQPGVARNIIEMPSNAEKGLSHRFLWVFPKPLYGSFETLQEVNKEFTTNICEFVCCYIDNYVIFKNNNYNANISRLFSPQFVNILPMNVLEVMRQTTPTSCLQGYLPKVFHLQNIYIYTPVEPSLLTP